MFYTVMQGISDGWDATLWYVQIFAYGEIDAACSVVLPPLLHGVLQYPLQSSTHTGSKSIGQFAVPLLQCHLQDKDDYRYRGTATGLVLPVSSFVLVNPLHCL